MPAPCSSSPSPQQRLRHPGCRAQAALRLALAAALLLLAGPAAAGGRAAQRFLAEAPAPEQANVTAMDGAHPLADLAGAVAAAWLPQGLFRGDGTAYSEAVANSGKGFACSYRYLNDWASTHFAAINKPMWDEGAACGRCLTAWCVDDRCPTKGKRVQVMVVDQCPECKQGDVDFSIPVYRQITGSWPNRLAVQWEWSDCSHRIDGGIHMTPKDGINAQWQAFYFSNARFPLKSVALNGKPLDRNEFQFWVHAAPLPSGPATLEFEAENGARLTAACDNPLADQVLPNFA